jgi:nitrile hydratase accessory protein
MTSVTTPGSEPLLRGGTDRDDGAMFGEPWEAHAFAIVLTLHRRGLFSWREWTDTLAAQIAQAQRAGDADLGDRYYRHWLGALERLVVRKGASSAAELHRFQRAWDRAADRTPHGQPIELHPADFDQDDPSP